MTLRLGGDGAITGCTSLEEPTLSVSGLLVTTPIVATSGTVAAPSYTFTGDTNTGFYQPNGDAIGASLGGEERAILDSSSNNTWLLIKSRASTGAGAELFLGNGYSEGSISYSHGTGNTNRNLMFKTAGTEKMRLDSYGNLGLGVTPNNTNNFKTFTLAGVTGGNIEFQDGGTLIGSIYNLADQFIIQGQGSTIPVAFRTNSTERMRITADGKIGIGTSSPGNTLEIKSTTNGDGIRLSNAVGSYYHLVRSNGDGLLFDADAGSTGGSGADIRFNVKGSEKMRITNVGRVGIGTTSPSHGLLTLSQSALSAFNALVIQQGNTGSTANDGLHIGIDSGVDAYIMHKENRAIFFGTGNSERMRIDAGGDVAIGMTPAGKSLSIQHAANPTLGFYTGSTLRAELNITTADTSLRSYANSPIFFEVGAERMRITSSAKVGINTYANTGAGLHVDNVSGTTAYGQPVIKCGSSTSWTGNGTIYSIGFGYANGETVKQPTEIGILTTSSTGFTKGALVFATRDVTTNTAPTERMRLNSGGNLLINTTARNYGGMLEIKFNGSVDNGLVLETTRDALNSAFLVFVDSDGNTIGSVQQNGATTVHYGTSSDYRLKENVVNLTGAIPRLKTLPVHRFNFIADSETTVDGFLAHEAQLVVPEAVTGTHNELDGDGNAVMQGIDQSKLVPLLTAALQEAIAKIETLEAKVAALET